MIMNITIVSILIVFIGFLGTTWQSKKVSNEILKYIILLILSTILFSIGHSMGSKEASIKALKGNNPYEQNIIKTYKDGEIISTDTTYNKK